VVVGGPGSDQCYAAGSMLMDGESGSMMNNFDTFIAEEN